MKIKYFILLKFFLSMSAFIMKPSFAFDQNKYDEFLNKFVTPGKVINGITINAVNYYNLNKELKTSSAFNELFDSLKKFDPDTLPDRKSKIAFWINVYNLGTLKLINDHYPVKSIRSSKINLFTYPWGKKFINVNGKKLSLSYIEYEILFGKFEELKAHFAINCASLSCPDLSQKAYTGNSLDEDISQQARSFLKDKKRGMRIDRKNKKVFISRIFKFDSKNFSRGKKDIVPFILPFIENKEDREFLAREDYDLKFLPYDWKLNGF